MNVSSNIRKLSVNFLVGRLPILALFIFATPLITEAQKSCTSVFVKNEQILSQNKICCEPVTILYKKSSLNQFSSDNPYTIGRKKSFNLINPLFDYAFSAPDVLKGTLVQQLDYKNNSSPLDFRIKKFLNGLEQTRVLKEIGQGGLAKVYLYDPEAPLLNSSEWLKTSAKYVVKFRHYFANRDEHYKNYLIRDLAMRGVAEELSKKVSFKLKPLIRVAKDFSTIDDLIEGRFVQEAVHGPSAFALAEALFEFQINNSEKSRTTIEQAGFIPSNPSSLKDLKDQIAALEKFYFDTHDIVLFFNMKNTIYNLGNISNSGKTTMVGLDLGHGNNVLYDPKTEQWVIIDW